MRAGPLSSPEVVATLNRSFVPVYLSNEDYAEGGPCPEAERRQRDRIVREAAAKGLSTGTVHVYILDPEGHAVDSAHVAEGARLDVLRRLLDRNVARFRPEPGPPACPPRPQATVPEHEPGGLTLHLVARSLDGRGAWGGVIPEDWFTLSADEAMGLTVDNPAVGRAWDLPPARAARLLERFYPATENNDLAKNRIERAGVRAEVVSVEAGVRAGPARGRPADGPPLLPRGGRQGRRGEGAGVRRLRRPVAGRPLAAHGDGGGHL